MIAVAIFAEAFAKTFGDELADKAGSRLGREGPDERVRNLLTPSLSSTGVWRRGRRRGRIPFMSQPWF
jgi:hypothetical protein